MKTLQLSSGLQIKRSWQGAGIPATLTVKGARLLCFRYISNPPFLLANRCMNILKDITPSHPQTRRSRSPLSCFLLPSDGVFTLVLSMLLVAVGRRRHVDESPDHAAHFYLIPSGSLFCMWRTMGQLPFLFAECSGACSQMGAMWLCCPVVSWKVYRSLYVHNYVIMDEFSHYSSSIFPSLSCVCAYILQLISGQNLQHTSKCIASFPCMAP